MPAEHGPWKQRGGPPVGVGLCAWLGPRGRCPAARGGAPARGQDGGPGGQSRPPSGGRAGTRFRADSGTRADSNRPLGRGTAGATCQERRATPLGWPLCLVCGEFHPQPSAPRQVPGQAVRRLGRREASPVTLNSTDLKLEFHSEKVKFMSSEAATTWANAFRSPFVPGYESLVP